MILLLQLRKIISTFLLIAVFLSVAGCGGGGNDASSNNSGGTIQGPPQSLDELRISRENELSTVAELNVEVQINANKSFLSICDIPGEEIDVDGVNYEKCILRTPIANNLNEIKITLPTHTYSLVSF